MDFNPGDTVRLKSGGPLMTVESLRRNCEEEKVFCTWFTTSHEHRRDWFGPDIIEQAQ